MTLADGVVGVAVLTILAGMTAPYLAAARERSQALAAARRLAAEAMLARARAVRHGAAVALRFDPDAGGHRFTIFVDGDGDGVHSDDVSRGIDRPLGPEQRLRDAYPGARFELGASTPAVGSTRSAGPNADPIRLGRSDTLTFSPLGTATSGTLYLRGRTGEQHAVRITGATARVRVLSFDAASGAWRDR